MSKGSLVWRFETEGPVLSSPSTASNMVFIGSDDARLYALDTKTSDLIWSNKTGLNFKSTPVNVNGRLYVGSEDGYIYCFGPGSGILPQNSETTQPPTPQITLMAVVLIVAAILAPYL